MVEGDLGIYQNSAAAVLGLPFFDEIPECTSNQIAAAKLVSPSAAVVNDVRVAFDGAFAGGPGALILSGTGSMAWASNGKADAPHYRVGGWGERFGDEGSGFWIGREALATMSHCLDHRNEATDFTNEMLSCMSISAGELQSWAYENSDPRKLFSSLALYVATLADQSNPDAISIIDRAAIHLALQLKTAWQMTGSEDQIIWSYSGSVTKNELLRKKITDELGCEPMQPKLPPIGGALFLAAKQANWNVDDTWITKLRDSIGLQIK